MQTSEIQYRYRTPDCSAATGGPCRPVHQQQPENSKLLKLLPLHCVLDAEAACQKQPAITLWVLNTHNHALQREQGSLECKHTRITSCFACFQAIMTDIEPARRAPSPPRQRPAPEQAAVKQQQPAAATPRPASPLKGSAVPQQQQFQRPVMPSKIPGPPREIGPPTVTETGQRSPQLSTSLNRQHQQHQYQQQLPPLQPALQQQQVPQHDEPGTLEGYEQDLHLQQHMRQQNPNDGYSQPRQPSGRMQPLLGPVSNGRVWDAPEHAASQLSPAAVQAAALALAGLSNTNEMALDPATGALSRVMQQQHHKKAQVMVSIDNQSPQTLLEHHSSLAASLYRLYHLMLCR